MEKKGFFYYYDCAMYSDTHFHFHNLVEQHGLDAGSYILQSMADNNTFFGLDIGTKADDLDFRQECIMASMYMVEDNEARQKIEDFIYFSAGIWPDTESIKNRQEEIKTLIHNITLFTQDDSPFCDKLVAIGEGGIDHHWNPSGVDGRSEGDFDKAMYEGEKELFAMQLDVAKQMDLPFIVHSRDGFEDTLDVIKNVGYNKGIIHCFSYGLKEAKAFLDLGWYISFSGSVTYTKKAAMASMEELLRYIPNDRLLIETDSPYLAPVPQRGKQNNPLFIKHTYDFVAAVRNIKTEELCSLVDENAKKLFKI